MNGAASPRASFFAGWASGGLAFGVLGDRIGRARTMLLTILLYSLCTGLEPFFRCRFWDFAIYRFLTGLGVGGEFAVGVAGGGDCRIAPGRWRLLGYCKRSRRLATSARR